MRNLEDILYESIEWFENFCWSDYESLEKFLCDFYDEDALEVYEDLKSSKFGSDKDKENAAFSFANWFDETTVLIDYKTIEEAIERDHSDGGHTLGLYQDIKKYKTSKLTTVPKI